MSPAVANREVRWLERMTSVTRAKRSMLAAAGLSGVLVLGAMGLALAAGSSYAFDMRVPGFGGTVTSTQVRTATQAPYATVYLASDTGGGTMNFAVANKAGQMLSSNWIPIAVGSTTRFDAGDYNGQQVRLMAGSSLYQGLSTVVQGTWTP